MLTTDERKDKIRKLIGDLSARLNEMLWSDSLKFYRAIKYRPSFFVEFWKRWDDLDARCAEYLRGEIDWDGDCFQMDFTSTGHEFPVLRVERDVHCYALDLFSWAVLETKGL